MTVRIRGDPRSSGVEVHVAPEVPNLTMEQERWAERQMLVVMDRRLAEKAEKLRIQTPNTVRRQASPPRAQEVAVNQESFHWIEDIMVRGTPSPPPPKRQPPPSRGIDDILRAYSADGRRHDV